MKKKTKLKDYFEDFMSKEDLQIANTSFEVVGDIAIIEIPPELDKKYDKEIGKSLMKVNSSINTVLKKSGIHGGEFRTQDMEYIAGEEKEETIYTENGIRLKIDPSAVYFSARLSTERSDLMDNLEEDKRVLIMFSGCGPYTYVALKKQPNLSRITSIEINPKGHEYAIESLKLNKNLIKKSKLYKNIVEFLKKNNLPVNDKYLTEIFNNLKVSFINDDVRETVKDLKLKIHEEDIPAYDNYIFKQNIEDIYKSLKDSTKDILYLDLDKVVYKSDILPFITIFSQKFSFVCKIEEKKYGFDDNLSKGYLLNYLENPKLDIERINLFDEIFMPLPKDAEHFLDATFAVADKDCIIHMYDFVHENEFPQLSEQKVLESADKYKKKVEIISTRKVGQYSPRKFRVCCDFKIQ